MGNGEGRGGGGGGEGRGRGRGGEGEGGVVPDEESGRSSSYWKAATYRRSMVCPYYRAAQVQSTNML